MPTPTTHLGLLKPGLSDPFVTEDIADNLQTLDDHPGYFVCTSTSRPAWGAAQAGMLISETDTLLIWRWSGTAWQRVAPRGVLTTTSGAKARGQRTSDLGTTSTSYVIVASIPNVVVPAGNRPLMIVVTWYKAEATSGSLAGSIRRANANNAAPEVASWYMAGDATAPATGSGGGGGTFVTFEPDGLAPGTYSWSFQIKAFSGTAYIRANATTPAEITVIEL